MGRYVGEWSRSATLGGVIRAEVKLLMAPTGLPSQDGVPQSHLVPIEHLVLSGYRHLKASITVAEDLGASDGHSFDIRGPLACNEVAVLPPGDPGRR